MNTFPSWTISLKTAETALNRTHYLRAYVNFVGFPPAGSCGWMQINQNGIIYIGSDGTLRLVNNNGGQTQIGSSSAALVLNTWYMVEIAIFVNTGTVDSLEARLDGVVFATGTSLAVSDSVTNAINCGFMAGIGATSFFTPLEFYIDDIALNDSTGATQNSYPGAGKTVLLRAVSDNARGSWTDGAGGTTSLFESLNNSPPQGSATLANGNQIKNSSNAGATNLGTWNCTDYATAGIGSGDVITLVQAVVDHGEALSPQTKSGTIKIGSNPAQSVADTFSYGDDAGAAGTWPSVWAAQWGSAQVGDIAAANRATQPTLILGKVDTTTREAWIDFAGLIVEYVEGLHPAIGGLPDGCSGARQMSQLLAQ